jgi:hypothetical protein
MPKPTTTNDILATDTPATMREFLILQMRETCKRQQDLEEAIKNESDKESRKLLESLLSEAVIEHLQATQSFKAFLKGNPPLMKAVTHLKLA